MSQLRDTDQMILVCTQPILRTKIVNVINPMNQEWTIGQDYHSEEHPSVVFPDGIKKSECLAVKKDLVFEGENSIFIEESVVTGDEKCTTCLDDVGTSIELEIFGIKDENVLMADKPSTMTKNSVTSNIYAEKDASIENFGTLEKNSIEDNVEMSGTDVDEILIEENVTTSNENYVTNTVNVRQEHFVISTTL